MVALGRPALTTNRLAGQPGLDSGTLTPCPPSLPPASTKQVRNILPKLRCKEDSEGVPANLGYLWEAAGY